jgi:tRNA modification GTPase
MAKVVSNEDTIAALATPFGEGAVGIVRLSGAAAVPIVDRVFRAKNKKSLSTQKSFTLRYGWVVRKKQDPSAGVIDEVIVSVMRAPKSYTREDVVEINAHGGPRALALILERVCEEGARLAEPGEFTKRAFLNGRLDLAQAEAVLDIIRAKSDLALKNSCAQLSGEISRVAEALRASLVEVLAEVEAGIDFSEEEVGPAPERSLPKKVADISARLSALIERSSQGKVIREGLNVVLCGRPNVGKSSLLNALLKEERAIVTPIAGTTRDTIEEFINIKGLAVRLMDTAGIREHRDEIEKEALVRTQKAIAGCDLVIFVLDAGTPLADDDKRGALELGPKKKIVVINKSDLERSIDVAQVEHFFGQKPLFVSALKLDNIAALEGLIFESVFDRPPSFSEGVYVSNARHALILKEALASLKAVATTCAQGLSLEFAALDLKKALDALGALTGEVFNEELLDAIFSKFCIGK